MKDSTINKILSLLFIFCLFSTLISASAVAADYHVAISGDDEGGNGTIESPWRHPEYGAKQLTPGDTLYIHKGTYSLSTDNLPVGQSGMDRGRALVSPPYDVNGTAENPFTIKAYENEDVLLDAGANPEYPAVGSNFGDYVQIDGLNVRGCAIIMWSNYGKITNCNLYGGIDSPLSNGGDNFGCVVRIEGSTGTIIENNRLHDNQVGITERNSPLLMEYDSTNLLIKNNDIYNSVGHGIRLKDNPENVTVSYNFIYNNAFAGVSSANQDPGHNISVHNNIFLDNNTSGAMDYGAILILICAADWRIYNNTFIDNNIADIRNSGERDVSGIRAWNNIMSRNAGNYYLVGWSSSGATFSGQWSYSNYNCFHGGQSWKEHSTTWDTLSAFNTGNGEGFDTYSNTNNPNFVNPEGTNPEDFKRTTYPKEGRGGEYASVMGAYITGNENIGTTGNYQQSTLEGDPLPTISLSIASP